MNNKVNTCLIIEVASHLDIINNKVKTHLIIINNKAPPPKMKDFFHECGIAVQASEKKAATFGQGPKFLKFRAPRHGLGSTDFCFLSFKFCATARC